MTQQEFEARTGLKVEPEAFEKINEMYMESGEHIDKDTFCADYKEHHNSVLLQEFYQQADRLKDKRDADRARMHDAAVAVMGRFFETKDYALREVACNLIGERAVVLLTAQQQWPFCELDVEYIKNYLR